VPLSDKGRAEAREAGRRMKQAALDFDVAFTSVLRRAIGTLWIALEEMELMWIPEIRDWRLNERHYGSLTGLDKSETAARHGEAQVLVWRRSYDIRPPPFAPEDPENPSSDRRYAELPPRERPTTESLKDTVARVVPCWEQAIAPRIRAGQRILIAAHGNSLRALVKHLDGIPDETIVSLNIPTGIPLVYELDHALRPLGSRYLASDDEVAAAQRAVAAQGKKRA
jgi:2,3-bisphosphoglycerate-dependent phosphoglycerate mutase